MLQLKSYNIIGKEHHKCIVVSDPSHLYKTSNKLVTHNSVTTSYAICMCAATLGKGADLLLTPFEQLIENSPYFEKVGRHDDITAINREDKECKKCYYSTAARGTAHMAFRNNLQLKLMSTEGALLGNAQPLYSKIMKPNGDYYTMGEVCVGDTIASPTEGSSTVIGVFPQGKRPIYEIELEDGRKVRASDNHLWKVAIDKIGDDWNWRIVTTLQLITWLQEGKEVEIYDESNDPKVSIPKIS